ncbi:hypothetical protein NPIL_504741 [Nephila pilipes]|uniref:Uncharacterized protein n=1 Tax=Nephila pilipes TaxID=299642 RepID=A0A8X6TNX1_NEPPI|nr:hypothetical protein NPIL_504741 [Nephila pilipes]
MLDHLVLGQCQQVEIMKRSDLSPVCCRAGVILGCPYSQGQAMSSGWSTSCGPVNRRSQIDNVRHGLVVGLAPRCQMGLSRIRPVSIHDLELSTSANQPQIGFPA